MEQRSAHLQDWGELLVERHRTLQEQLARTEDRVAATFECAALYHPDRAVELRSMAGEARSYAKQLRGRSTKWRH